jgi:alpha-L-arabinofuranosidase
MGIKNATLLAAILAGSPRMTFKNPISYGVPEIDVLMASAARSERGDVLVLKVVNFAPFGLKASIHISGMGRLRPTAKMVLLTGGNLNLDNTADQSTAGALS